jgi:hypothetical protein
MIYDYVVNGKRDFDRFVNTGVALVTTENLEDPDIQALLGN